MSALPRFGEEGGTCSTCGRGFPISHLILSRRFGWQCLPGLWGNGCYDGPVQRDELRYIPRPGEGTRRSGSPQYDLLTSDWEYESGARASYELRFRDHSTGTVWEFSPTDLTFTESSDQSSSSHGGWEFRSNARFWVNGGSFQVGSQFPRTYKYIPAPRNRGVELLGGTLVVTS